ncbi:hypothetical protein OG455_29820 [Kitasatospora sp. NBC_01287]|uniref:hypothetical protein n=1 Tax=Kitasatospora sp. NBC_01287 TaxID=2903573 RepID=UPI0022551286|nr:hypothetical protein [Kitasatospora sp. NBC_01287]MCX4749663.1 hypothetical protein [Kitasatospora sp. NBC_01287]
MTQPARRTGPLLALAVVLLLTAGAVTAALLWPTDKHPAAAPPPSPSPSPSPSASPAPSPSPSPSKQLPYPWFPVGACLQDPELSPAITIPQAAGCDQPHDAQAIGNPTLPDGLTKASQIGLALVKACQPVVAAWEAQQGGGTWYPLQLEPPLGDYQKGFRDATCVLAASRQPGGTKLTAPLKQ